MAGSLDRRHDDSRTRRVFHLLAATAMLLMVPTMESSAGATELSPGISQLYTSVSIYPPTAKSMTVCYGFVCWRREVIDFKSADRAALTRILAAG